MNINDLRRLRFKLLGVKPTFLTIREIQEILKNDRYMPTAIFSAKKEDYIVKPRTIYGKAKRRSNGRIISC